MSAHRVVVTREDGNWLADVPSLPGAHTFARNLETLERYVREVVVLAADLPDDSEGGVELDWDYRTGDRDLDGRLASLRLARRDLEVRRLDVERQTVESVRRLVGEGFSVRDVAALTGLSRARVQQLIDAAAIRPARTSPVPVVPAVHARRTPVQPAVSGGTAEAAPAAKSLMKAGAAARAR